MNDDMASSFDSFNARLITNARFQLTMLAVPMIFVRICRLFDFVLDFALLDRQR